MKTIPKIPKIGDILVFEKAQTFFCRGSKYLEVDKGDMCQVVGQQLDHVSDEEYNLILLLAIQSEDGVITTVSFPYYIKANDVRILEQSQALRILYGKK